MSTAFETATYIGDIADPAIYPGDSGASGKRGNGAAELRKLKDILTDTLPALTGQVTSTHTELNILDGVTSTAAELNVLDGVTAFLDEDDLASDSATAIASQQSIKAKIDNINSNLVTLITAVQDDVNASTDGPGFRATHSTTQTVNNTTSEFAFDTEAYDTDNDFASNQFTPSRAGKYFVASTIKVQATGSNAPRLRVELRKNGTEIIAQHSERNSTVGSSSEVSVSTMIDLDGSTDYVSVFVNFSDANNTGTADGSNTCSFTGQWIRS